MDKGLITRLGEAIDQYRAERRTTLSERATPRPALTRSRVRRWLLPTPGNVLFTFLIVAGLLWATNAGALPLGVSATTTASTGTIAYQGRLADSAGEPITDTVNMEFRLYDVAEGGTSLWSELWTGSNAVRVSDGLFNVMLGSLDPIPQAVVAGHDQLWLGITVGTDDEMSPRVQLGSVPLAMTAQTLPAGTHTQGDLTVDGKFTIRGGQDTQAIISAGDGGEGGVRFISDHGDWVTDLMFQNNEQTHPFAVVRGGGGSGSAVLRFFTRPSDEDMWPVNRMTIRSDGTMDMNGNSIVNQGAMVEAGLQTPDELASESIDRFSEGDVLCWAGKRLEKCDQANDRRVVAVADENGKPIVIGAELVKVLGPVQAGDLLVASDVPGYAVVNNQPVPGTVIAKALEDFAGERGTIKAMIRNF